MYKINCYCNNCSHHFITEVPKGVIIEKSKSGSGIFHKIPGSTYGTKIIQCPNCETYEVVKNMQKKELKNENT